MDKVPRYRNSEYTMGWLCALPTSELTAARMMLDREHNDPDNTNEHDKNSYIFGEIHGHKVVIACMPPQTPGNLSAQKLVQPLKQSFPNMKLHLFVGIGGGIPRNPPTNDSNKDIHLGDVVIGWAEQPGTPAVVQYDHVRRYVQGEVELLSMLDKPNRQLLSALGVMISDRDVGQTKYPGHLQRLSDFPRFRHPGLDNDTLFEASYDHVAFESKNSLQSDHSHCYQCDPVHIIKRPPRETTDPQFHLGTILSGNSVMQDPRKRDKLSQKYHDALCFEMEAAGVNEDTHCLVIRGISDYADSHKYWSWQDYAAATAAAFARELLHKIRPVVLANGGFALNGFASTTAKLEFVAKFCTLHYLMDLGEQHSRKPPLDRKQENLSAALSYFAKAETVLRESGSRDPSLQLNVSFRLMTIESDLSHNRHWSIDERIQHIRHARENGFKASIAALLSGRKAFVAQVGLEQAFVKGRMAELEEQKGATSVEEIWRVKGETLREMNDAMGLLENLNGDKHKEYLGRAEEWEARLQPKRDIHRKR